MAEITEGMRQAAWIYVRAREKARLAALAQERAYNHLIQVTPEPLWIDEVLDEVEAQQTQATGSGGEGGNDGTTR